MIQASELRENAKLLFLGEVVTFDYIERKRPDGIFWIKTKEHEISHKNFHFKAIELSEEIFLKCPQTKKDGDAIILMDRFRFTWQPQYKYWYVLTKDYYEYLTKIEFVHELQNFVYPLSGTELEINL